MAFGESSYKFISLAIVLKDKPTDTDVIECYPYEIFPFEKGKIGSDTSGLSAEFVNRSSTPGKVELKGGKTFNAFWLRDNASNRVTSPDVVRGETVKIYQCADDPCYYWEDTKNQSTNRKLETVRMSFSNTPNGNEKLTDDNSYFVEYSTHTKQIRIHTSTSNGEPTTFDIVINAGEGVAHIKDGLGQGIIYNAVEGTLQGEMNETISLKAKHLQFVGTESVSVETQSSTIKASSHTTEADNITNDGPVALTKGMTVASGGGSTATAIQMEGTLNVDGGASFSEPITAPAFNPG